MQLSRIKQLLLSHAVAHATYSSAICRLRLSATNLLILKC